MESTLGIDNNKKTDDFRKHLELQRRKSNFKMGQESQSETQTRMNFLSKKSKLPEKAEAKLKPLKHHRDQDNSKDMSSHVSLEEKKFLGCKKQKRGEARAQSTPDAGDSESVPCGSELLASGEAVKITPERPTSGIPGPSRKFKRPKSYIHGRANTTRPHGDSESLQESEKSHVASCCGVEQVNKSALPDSAQAQEDQEQASLNRINYLNRRLKQKASTGAYFKPLPEDDFSGIVLDPDPPAWSYESYSESERQGATLPGLRSYIRANESHLEGGADDGEVESSPHESIVTYLDGVLSDRYPVRRCSMSFEPCAEDDETRRSEPDHHRRRRHGRRSPRRSEGNSRDGRHGGGNRSCSGETVRRLEIGVCKDNQQDKAFEKAAGNHRSIVGDLGESKQRNLPMKRESGGSKCRPQFETSPTKKQHSRRERSSSPPAVQGKSHENSNYMIDTKRHVRSNSENNLRPTSESSDTLEWEEESEEEEDEEDNERTSLSRIIGTKTGLTQCALPASANTAHTLDKDTMAAADRELLILPSQRDGDHMKSVGELIVHSGRAAPPVLQAQESPLAVDDGYLVSDEEEDGDFLERSSPVVGDAQGQKKRKPRRLVVQKDRACARVWSSSKTLQKSEQQSLSRLFPRLDRDRDDNEADGNSVEEYDEEAGDEEEDDDEYEDLIIQTELSEGSKVTVSNYSGPIADIEHGKEDVSEIKQYKVMTYTPETGEINILSDRALSKVGDKSQNNGKYDKSDASSIGSYRAGQTKRHIDDRDVRQERRAPNHNRSPRGDTKRSSKTSPRTKSTTAKAGYSVGKPRHTAANETARTKRTGLAGSPPKSSTVATQEMRRSDGAGRTSRPEANDLDEIEIPMGQDGKTRVLLVLRTPPKKARDGEQRREKCSRRSPERRVRSATPDELPPQRRSSTPVDEKGSPGIEQAKSIQRRTSREKITLEGHNGSGQFDGVMVRPVDAGERLEATQFLNGSSSLDLANQAPSPYQRKGKRRRYRRHRFDSLVPKQCGQDGEGPLTGVESEMKEEGGIRTLVENVYGNDGDVVKGPTSGGDDTPNEPCVKAEQLSKAHGPCKFGRFQPCSHDDSDTQLNRGMNPTKPERRRFDKGRKPTGISDANNMETERGPCSFSRFQPCCHVSHTPCQFDRFKPCQHEECETSDAAFSDLSDTFDPAASRKQEPQSRRSGYVYNSKKLQEKLGQHSPCVFDRYKPCLHEEVVGPLANVKNKAEVSLLSHASKPSNKNDAKAKSKDTNSNLLQCKFNRYTPCFHDNDVKFNRALGRKASLRSEKPKTKQAESQDADGSCKFSRFKPCFCCPDNVETPSVDNPEALASTEEKPPPQQLRLNGQTSSLKDKKSLRYGGDFATPKEKVSSSVDGAKDSVTVSSQDGAGTGKALRSSGGDLTTPASDGPSVSTRAATPGPKVAVGAGDGEILKADGDEQKADGDCEQAGGMSIMTKISRAWFSSAQAQVARLAPPQHVIVTPSLRTDKGLGCGTVKSPDQAEVTVNGAAAAAAVALTAVAESYNAAKQSPPKSPRKYRSACGDREVIPYDRQGRNQSVQWADAEENPFKAQRVYELSLADTTKTCESYETDMSQVTEMPELTASSWTLPRARSGGIYGQEELSAGETERITVTETCSGQGDSIEHHSISQQLWTEASGLPEQFLMLTSNVYPLSPEGGDIGDTADTPKLVEAGPEVLSADPLPVHFSDVARAKRVGEAGGGGGGVGRDRRRLLNKNHRELCGGQAELTLYHSSQRHHAGDSWTSDDYDNLSPQETLGAVLGQDKCLNHVEDEVDVQTFLQNRNALGPRNEDPRRETDVSFTTRGDVSADPLPRSRKHKPIKPNTRPGFAHKGGSVSESCQRASVVGQNGSNERSLDAEINNSSAGKDVILGQDYILQVCENFEGRSVPNQAKLDREIAQADVPSRDRQAVVVAAAELASYKSLLDTISKIARVDPATTAPADGQGVSAEDHGLRSSINVLEVSSGHRADTSRRHHRSPSTDSRCSSSAGTSGSDSCCTNGEEQSDVDNGSDVTSSESATRSGDGDSGGAGPDIIGDGFVNDFQTTRPNSKHYNGRFIPEMLEAAETTINEAGDKKKPQCCVRPDDGEAGGRRAVEAPSNAHLYGSVYGDGLHTEDISETSMANIMWGCHGLTSRDSTAGVVQTVCNPVRSAFEPNSLKEVGKRSAEDEDRVGLLCHDAHTERARNITMRGGIHCGWQKSVEDQTDEAYDETAEESSVEDDEDSSEAQDSDDTDLDEEEEDIEEEDEIDEDRGE